MMLLISLLALAASPSQAQPISLHARSMFISPMGEPFRDHSGDALADWFNGADANHDGRLTLLEMQKDAERFFALLDVNHDGEIDPDEITRYETVVAPEISSGRHFDMAAFDASQSRENAGQSGGRGHGGGGHHGGSGRHRGGGSGSINQGAARFGLLDLPEPVVAADSDFNRGVSPNEFKEAAGQRFLALDLDHHGYLTLAGLATIRPEPAPQPNRDVIPGQPPSDPSTQD
jgi:hypothetical protein